MYVFVSHASRDQPVLARLRTDFERLGHRVWYDRDQQGGQDWWDAVVHRVRDCAAFVLVLSPDSLDSPACMAQLRYALALRRPVMVVRAAPVEAGRLPAELGGRHVDYTAPEAGIELHKAFNALPMAKQLTGELPVPPPLPGPSAPRAPSPGRTTASRDEQVLLFSRLHGKLADPRERAAAWEQLVALRSRPGLDAQVALRLERVLSPGWQPDPRGHFEGRYWDGQSWTTLIRQNGQEFNDRNTPPTAGAYLSRTGEDTGAGKFAAVAPPQKEAESAPVAESRADQPAVPRKLVPWLAGGGLLVAAGVVGAFLLVGGGNPGEGSATALARNFVDAVNTRDEAAMQRFVCDADIADNAHLYRGFLEAANVTLESVDVSGADPRFTVLAARTGSSSVKLNIPLAEQDGEWRVCDISKALSGR